MVPAGNKATPIVGQPYNKNNSSSSSSSDRWTKNTDTLLHNTRPFRFLSRTSYPAPLSNKNFAQFFMSYFFLSYMIAYFMASQIKKLRIYLEIIKKIYASNKKNMFRKKENLLILWVYISTKIHFCYFKKLRLYQIMSCFRWTNLLENSHWRTFSQKITKILR